jgi:hypothetical protein
VTYRRPFSSVPQGTYSLPYEKDAVEGPSAAAWQNTVTLIQREAMPAQERNEINVQVIRSYSWAAVQSQQNSQRKPVNNCGGSQIFLKCWFQIWKSGGRPQKAQPACYEWI